MAATQGNVIIVGAGPTGLLLAGDIAAADVPCTVLERRGDEANTTRAFGVNARSLEELDMRGVADELAATGMKFDRLQLFGDMSLDLSTLPSRFPYSWLTPQYNTERVLEKRARALGAEFVTGATVSGLRQDEAGVTVSMQGEDGAVSTRRAAYLVGADGVRSAVREAIAMPYPGESVLQSVVLADVRLSETPPSETTAVVDAARDGFVFIVPFGDGWFRILAWDRLDEQPDRAPVDFDRLRRLVRRTFGTDYGMHDPRWTSRFHSDERQVPRYRVGRVFLAGDAAHCHSPAGGLGMNTGLQDAANLGWKLAAVLHGWHGESLLDSYHAERHPVGRLALRSSGRLIRAMTAKSWVTRRARDLIGGAALRIGPISRKIAEIVSGVAIGYPAPRGAHPSVGRRIADVPLTGQPSRLYEALRGGRFVLLSRESADLDLDRRHDRVVTATPSDPASSPILVRPDGYIAWATNETDPTRRATALRAALAEWCGA